jgi:hypothetical protein
MMKHVCNGLCAEGYHALLFRLLSGPDAYSLSETIGRVLAETVGLGFVSAQVVTGPLVPFGGNIGQSAAHCLAWARELP